ncbi:phytanoyl-CoA dioxygenase family protein [Lacibacterium aquatile]|uniref:Phytanoyl-CoA dioxygenase family protein n=1 Tax=Lacibacterium aquatile TaxID=1168082 RepID=A0ABW5DTF2_9PROT
MRAVLFDKSAASNWALGWHQDRTIVVKERREVDGFGPWSVKSGLQHVEPPFAIIASMVTLRIHLDPVGPDNAPLLIVPGSHRLGRIPQIEIEGLPGRLGSASCLAAVGDVWAYATPVVHASDAARIPANRRVLQVDYSAARLPGGIEWLGI